MHLCTADMSPHPKCKSALQYCEQSTRWAGPLTGFQAFFSSEKVVVGLNPLGLPVDTIAGQSHNPLKLSLLVADGPAVFSHSQDSIYTHGPTVVQ